MPTMAVVSISGEIQRSVAGNRAAVSGLVATPRDLGLSQRYGAPGKREPGGRDPLR